MRILIVSDTHRKHENLERVLEKVKPLDLLIHLGDAEGAEDYIEAVADCPVEIIAGNNDFFSRLERECELRIGKYKVLLTHGHYYYVSVGMEQLCREARARGADIVMFGHTHRPCIEYMQDLVALNPGSISYPRQEGRRPSYIMMEIDERQEAHYTLNYVDFDKKADFDKK